MNRVGHINSNLLADLTISISFSHQHQKKISQVFIGIIKL